MTLSDDLDDLASRTAEQCKAIDEDPIRQALDESIEIEQRYRGRPPERIPHGAPTSSVADDNAAARARVTPDRPTGTASPLFGGDHEERSYDPIGNAWDAVLIARMAGMSCGDELLSIAGIRQPGDPHGGLRLITDGSVHNVRLVRPAADVATIVADCNRSWPNTAQYAAALTIPTPDTEAHPDRCDTCRPDGPPLTPWETP